MLQRYDVHYTQPSLCAAELASGKADLGLVPIGALPLIPDVVAVHGCTIASMHTVRSIQLVVRTGMRLEDIRTIAADSASRSSSAYVQILLRLMGNSHFTVEQHAADLPAMLAACDAALLIGDPALLALEARDHQGLFARCVWHDVAELWTAYTGLPWVAAVWAVRTGALSRTGIAATQLTVDLTASRDHGLAHVPEIVEQWLPRIALPERTLRAYLTSNIHYHLDAACLAGIERFYTLAAELGILPAYSLRMLQGEAAVATSR